MMSHALCSAGQMKLFAETGGSHPNLHCSTCPRGQSWPQCTTNEPPPLCLCPLVVAEAIKGRLSLMNRGTSTWGDA